MGKKHKKEKEEHSPMADDDEPKKLGGGFMGDIQAIKEAPLEDLGQKKYDVCDFYWETGFFQRVARSGPFNNITLGIISFNALWMGIDTDLNDADTLAGADWPFQIGEHFFAVFFTGELFIRYMAFRKKCNCLKDGWFKFDAVLVSLMVFETWALPMMAGGGDEGTGLPIDTSMLRLLRLLRLSRMMRLLRKCPELLTLLKGMVAAVRSVFSTLVLLVVFMYIFAIIFRQQTKGNEALADYFGSMGLCFWTLLLQGTLLDDITDVLTEIKDDTPALAALFLVFVLLGNFTVLNMLIGVLCEVVSAVSDAEKEKTQVEYAKDSFLEVLGDLDQDGSGTICKDEFESFLNHPKAKIAFEELDVDRENLLTLADVIFEAEEETQADIRRQITSFSMMNLDEGIEKTISDSGSHGKKGLDFAQVLEAILDLRNSNTAMVKDVVELRKFIRGTQKQTHMYIVELSKQMQAIQQQSAAMQSSMGRRASTKDLERRASSIERRSSTSDSLGERRASSLERRSSRLSTQGSTVSEATEQNATPQETTVLPPPAVFSGDLSEEQLNEVIEKVSTKVLAEVEDILVQRNSVEQYKSEVIEKVFAKVFAEVETIDMRLKAMEQVEDAKRAVLQRTANGSVQSESAQDQIVGTYLRGRLAEKDSLMQNVLGLLQDVLEPGNPLNLQASKSLQKAANASSANGPSMEMVPHAQMDQPMSPQYGNGPNGSQAAWQFTGGQMNPSMSPSKRPRAPAEDVSFRSRLPDFTSLPPSPSPAPVQPQEHSDGFGKTYLPQAPGPLSYPAPPPPAPFANNGNNPNNFLQIVQQRMVQYGQGPYSI